MEHHVRIVPVVIRLLGALNYTQRPEQSLKCSEHYVHVVCNILKCRPNSLNTILTESITVNLYLNFISTLNAFCIEFISFSSNSDLIRPTCVSWEFPAQSSGQMVSTHFAPHASLHPP